MNNFRKLFVVALAITIGFSADAKKKADLEEYVMEESGLNVTKITNEDMNSVVGPVSQKANPSIRTANIALAGSKKGGLQWGASRTLAISPDGSELAYLTRKNKNDNVMVRRSSGAGASTQRTFRNVRDFCWGPDDNLYISDMVDNEHHKIVSIDAHKGATMRQLTSNNVDFNPATLDGNIIFFTRYENNGPSIWSYNKETGELVNCARGYQATPISDKEFLCVRNSTDGNSELWLVNYVDGKETLIVSDKNMGFSNPSLSPDGKWILMQANAHGKKDKNLDLFVIKADGTQLTQLTYHRADDFCPVWSADGKQIYFISSRGNKNNAYNVWRMNFNLD